MGIYNCEEYLQQALDSLYAQTFQDFKIILCDDGSADRTYEIAAQNAAAHSNIVLIRNQRNMGLNHTLNRCLELADTEYCARMDGDDISLPTRFEKEVKFLDEHPEYAIVSCPMFYFDEDGVFGKGKGGNEPTRVTFIKGTPFCHAPCMVRSEAYVAVGGYTESKKLLRAEDYHLWMKMYAAGYRGYNLEECLYSMRDDRNAAGRRNWSARRNISYAMWLACRTLHLPLYAYAYCLSPLVKGLVPSGIVRYLHRKKLSGN